MFLRDLGTDEGKFLKTRGHGHKLERANALIARFPELPPVIEGSQMQDAIPTLAVLAAFNETPVRFTGIAEYKYLIFGIALILLMLFRSEGLMPARMHLLTYAKRAYQKATVKEIVAPESEDNPFAGDSKTLNLATEKEADEK